MFCMALVTTPCWQMNRCRSWCDWHITSAYLDCKTGHRPVTGHTATSTCNNNELQCPCIELQNTNMVTVFEFSGTQRRLIPKWSKQLFKRLILASLAFEHVIGGNSTLQNWSQPNGDRAKEAIVLVLQYRLTSGSWSLSHITHLSSNYLSCFSQLCAV